MKLLLELNYWLSVKFTGDNRNLKAVKAAFCLLFVGKFVVWWLLRTRRNDVGLDLKRPYFRSTPKSVNVQFIHHYSHFTLHRLIGSDIVKHLTGIYRCTAANLACVHPPAKKTLYFLSACSVMCCQLGAIK